MSKQSTRLSEDEIERYFASPEAEGWKREDGKWIARKYRFTTFPEAIAFVNKVADIAERLNHHPFIAIDYKLVTLRITSWHAGGLTALDFTAAKAFNHAFDGAAEREG